MTEEKEGEMTEGEKGRSTRSRFIFWLNWTATVKQGAGVAL